MDQDTLVGWLGAGGPIAIIFALITFVVKEYRTGRADRLAAPRVAAESDSAVVSATTDMVKLIRDEINVAIVSRNAAIEKADRLEELVYQLETQQELDRRIKRKLRIQIYELRNGHNPSVIPEESETASEATTP